MTYRIYVTDAIKAIGHLEGQRYYDVLADLLNPKPVETRTAEEIKQGIIEKLNKLGRED